MITCGWGSNPHVVLMGVCWHDGLSEFGRYICDGILALMDCPNGKDEFGVCDGNSKLMDCQMGMKCHHI